MHNYFLQERFSKTALYLLENYDSAEKMAHMNSASYDNLRCISRGKSSPQKFIELKALATNFRRLRTRHQRFRNGIPQRTYGKEGLFTTEIYAYELCFAIDPI